MADDKKIIFSMVGVNKIYPPQKQVLKDIYLSFYYGAKIGILGLNGAGKSTLLKIIAGLEKSYQGDVVFSPGYSVGYLSQEPILDDTKTAKEVVMEGAKEVVDLLKEYEDISNKFGEEMTDEQMNKLVDRQARVQEKIEAHNGWEQEEKTESRTQKTLQRELEWVRMSPKGRHAKAKPPISAYDKLLNADLKQREEKLELFIPPGPRLGNVVIEAENISKAYDDKMLFENLTFSLPPAGIVGVIGPNGAGKTTLFRLILGKEKPDTGSIRIGDTVKTAYVDQSHHDLMPGKTVYEIISGGTDTMIAGGKQINSRAYVSRFNFSGTDQGKKLETLSGGERNRVHLAIALREGANVLRLDEPTNDIDINTLRALEEAIENFAGCAVVISHDRWFLDRIATHILAFEGDSQVYFFDGNFTEYEENKKQRLGDVSPHRIKYRSLVR